MGRVRTCCGCCDLTVGVNVVAGFTMAVSALLIALFAVGISYMESDIYKTFLHTATGGWVVGIMAVEVGINALWFLSAIFLIVGNVKAPKRKEFYIFWMVMTIITVVIAGLYLLFYLYVFLSNLSVMTGAYTAGKLLTLAGLITFESLWIYSLRVVFGHYDEIKELEAQDTQALVRTDMSQIVVSVDSHHLTCTPTGPYITDMAGRA